MSVVKLPKGTYDVYESNFGLYRCGEEDQYPFRRIVVLEWYVCRDSFHYQFDRSDTQAFFYVCDMERMAAFIKEVEDSLRLVFRTKFYKTNVDGICSIKPGIFWRNQKIKLSLFTIILRAGHAYKEGYWKKCLYQNEYIQDTKEAVNYFFSGYTKYTGIRRGWLSQFDMAILKGMSKKKTPMLLIRPSPLERFFGNIGLFIKYKILKMT